MGGELGLPLAALDADSLDDLRKQLTLVTTPWDDNPPETVYSYRERDGYIWIPRYFKPRVFWQLVAEWRWTLGKPYTFTPTGQLDPERGQVSAVPTMISHVRANSGGLLVAPTGTGKCLGPGTPVILADGRVAPVEDVATGDRLLGPDGEARGETHGGPTVRPRATSRTVQPPSRCTPGVKSPTRQRGAVRSATEVVFSPARRTSHGLHRLPLSIGSTFSTQDHNL